MKNNYSKILAVSLLTTVLFASPAFANCKAQVDAAASAQDARNKACNNASKPLKDKNLEQIKKGDTVCKAKEKAYKKAKENLRKCTSPKKGN